LIRWMGEAEAGAVGWCGGTPREKAWARRKAGLEGQSSNQTEVGGVGGDWRTYMSTSTIGRRESAIQGALGVWRKKDKRWLGGWANGEEEGGDQHHLTLATGPGHASQPDLGATHVTDAPAQVTPRVESVSPGAALRSDVQM